MRSRISVSGSGAVRSAVDAPARAKSRRKLETSTLGTPVELWLDGRVVPKARGRSAPGQRPYLPESYRTWKNQAIFDLSRQIECQRPRWTLVRVEATFYRFLRGDLDNLAGAVLDALVQAEILKDDTIACVRSLSCEWQDGDRDGAKIVILPYP